MVKMKETNSCRNCELIDKQYQFGIIEKYYCKHPRSKNTQITDIFNIGPDCPLKNKEE